MRSRHRNLWPTSSRVCSGIDADAEDAQHALLACRDRGESQRRDLAEARLDGGVDRLESRAPDKIRTCDFCLRRAGVPRSFQIDEIEEEISARKLNVGVFTRPGSQAEELIMGISRPHGVRMCCKTLRGAARGQQSSRDWRVLEINIAPSEAQNSFATHSIQ